MNYWLINCVAAFLLSVFFTGVLIPQILLVAFKRDLFDQPDERKIHRGAVPRLGGIAFTPVICCVLALLLGVSTLLGYIDMCTYMTRNAATLSFGFCSLFTLYLVGMSDDLIGVRYRAKFIMQILCAVLLLAGGLWLNSLHGVLWIQTMPWWLGMPLTVIVIVYIVNAINLIDGIDGLASGLSAAALIIYGCAFFMLERYVYAILSFSALGVLVPFFYYNVFGDVRKRKKIFMGDTGSLTIGLILSFLSLELYLASSVTPKTLDVNPFILAFTPLLIPCMDVVRVFMRRIRHHGNPFLPDKTHIHHKLLALGLKPRLCMVTIVAIALIISAVNILLSHIVNVTLLLVVDVLVWTLVNIWLSRKILARDNTISAAK